MCEYSIPVLVTWPSEAWYDPLLVQGGFRVWHPCFRAPTTAPLTPITLVAPSFSTACVYRTEARGLILKLTQPRSSEAAEKYKLKRRVLSLPRRALSYPVGVPGLESHYPSIFFYDWGRDCEQVLFFVSFFLISSFFLGGEGEQVKVYWSVHCFWRFLFLSPRFYGYYWYKLTAILFLTGLRSHIFYNFAIVCRVQRHYTT